MNDIMQIKKILKTLYVPLPESHKGQNGKLLIIGGSKRYHGAPMFSILAARRLVDLLYFHPGENDPYLINAIKTIPEAIVVFDLKIAKTIFKTFERTRSNDLKQVSECDCVLFGIGLADAMLDMRFDIDFIIKNANRLVIDGDGLKLIKNRLCELKPKSTITTILTPHEIEFQNLFGCSGTKENVKKMADSYGVVILKKDPSGDIISDGKRMIINKMHNQGMTKGGTGDVLAGLCAALFCKNPAFESAVAAAHINGYAGNKLKKKYGFNYCASDLANELAEAYSEVKQKV